MREQPVSRTIRSVRAWPLEVFDVHFQDAVSRYLQIPPIVMYLQETPMESEDFWEPVKVTVSEEVFRLIFRFKRCSVECPLCCETEKGRRTSLPCCDAKICKECAERWFTKESVFCPYCRKDIRETVSDAG